MIVGIDEVGRGPWAGPLVFGAVVLGNTDIEGLTDSKKLTKKKRETLEPVIKEQAVSYGLGWVHADELDQLGLAEACRVACRRALEQVRAPYSQIIIDGTVNFLKDTGKGPYVTTMKQADLLVPSVSAASILAKVARDRFMLEQDAPYPGYGFGAHVGYGTAAHRQALKELGVTPLHRKSFAPVATIVSPLAASPTAKRQEPRALAPTVVGNIAETAASDYLTRLGYRLIERNWKTKWCEVDIIAEKDGRVHFVEVKYRRVVDQGGGIAAITPKKLRQMKFAAELWLQRHGEHSTALSVVEVTGEKYQVTQFVPTITL